MNKKSDNIQKNQRIQVFARCRPLNSFEKRQCSPSIIDVIPDKKIVVKDRNAHREFFFDKVFSPDTKQISVYKAVVEPLIQEVLMGYNCTVFAYGQTGTGKTYTMEGERNDSQCSWEDDPGAGIIPRSLHQLFEDLNREENVEFSVRVSFLELYNEELFDLLSSTDLSRLRLYEDSSKKGSVIIQGLEEIIVNSKDEVYSILERGTSRRQTAATMLNATSSRSHTVFSVTVHIKENTIDGEELLKTGKLNLVDLAGSENVGRSGAVDKRAREAGNINQSLLTLGRVITALIEKQPHVPYRESKLTRLLQDSLGGHTKTSIIATISPALCNFDETISTLDYATKAKSITIKPEVNQKMTKRALIREYTEEIERMRKDLVALRSKEGFYIDHDNYHNLLTEITEKRETIKELAEKLDTLKEENAKIENMFCLTKEELTVTHEKLDKTMKQFEKTAVELINTQNTLNSTQQVLTETALERDEKQYLINVQKNTEKKLFQQAQKLLFVADENTYDVEKLHAKIDRKNIVEKTNEEKCQEFRVMYQRQFALLDEIVSHCDERQSSNLTNIKNFIDNLNLSMQSFKQKNDKSLKDFVSDVESKIKNVFTAVHSGSESLIGCTNSLINDSFHHKDVLFNTQNSFLSEKLPELINHMNDRNSELEGWIFNALSQLSLLIENEKKTLSSNTAFKKGLLSSVKQSFESWRNSYEDIIEEYRGKISSDCANEEKFEKEFAQKFQELKVSMSEIEELVGKQQYIRMNAAKLDSSIVSRLNEKVLTISEIQKPLLSLENFEDTYLGNQCSTLDSFLPVMNFEQFSEGLNKISISQSNLVSEINSFLNGYIELQENQFCHREHSLKNMLNLISESLLSAEEKMSVTHSSLTDTSNSIGISLDTQLQTVKNAIQNTDDVVAQSQELIQSTMKKLKDEILKRDMELEKFISEDLLKDVPTGTTPQRKVYSYPRLLVTTSPHDRILQRYRAQLAADTAIAINLPLNSSFSELEELKESISAEKSSEVTDDASFSSDDSTDTGSCASSMSDLSVDPERNKENKRSKKISRLPKKLPSSKVFIKPAPLSSRKPLLPSNNYETDNF